MVESCRLPQMVIHIITYSHTNMPFEAERKGHLAVGFETLPSPSGLFGRLDSCGFAKILPLATSTHSFSLDDSVVCGTNGLAKSPSWLLAVAVSFHWRVGLMADILQVVHVASSTLHLQTLCRYLQIKVIACNFLDDTDNKGSQQTTTLGVIAKEDRPFRHLVIFAPEHWSNESFWQGRLERMIPSRRSKNSTKIYI